MVQFCSLNVKTVDLLHDTLTKINGIVQRTSIIFKSLDCNNTYGIL